MAERLQAHTLVFHVEKDIETFQEVKTDKIRMRHGIFIVQRVNPLSPSVKYVQE